MSILPLTNAIQSRNMINFNKIIQTQISTEDLTLAVFMIATDNTITLSKIIPIVSGILQYHLKQLTQDSLTTLLTKCARFGTNISTNNNIFDCLINIILSEEQTKQLYKCYNMDYNTWFNSKIVHQWHMVFISEQIGKILINWTPFWNHITPHNVCPTPDQLINLIVEIVCDTTINLHTLSNIPRHFYTTNTLLKLISILSKNISPNYRVFDSRILHTIKLFQDNNIFFTLDTIMSLITTPILTSTIPILKLITESNLFAEDIYTISDSHLLTLCTPPHFTHITASLFETILSKCIFNPTMHHINHLCTSQISSAFFAHLLKIVPSIQLNENMFESSIKAHNLSLIEFFLSNKFIPKEDYVYKYLFPLSINTHKIIELFIQYGLHITPDLFTFINITHIKYLNNPPATINPHIHQRIDLITTNQKRLYNKIMKKTPLTRTLDDLRIFFMFCTLDQLKNLNQYFMIEPDTSCFEASLRNTPHVMIYVFDTYHYIPHIFDIMTILQIDTRFYVLHRFYPNLSRVPTDPQYKVPITTLTQLVDNKKIDLLTL